MGFWKYGIVLLLFFLSSRANAFDAAGSISSGGKSRSFVFHAPGAAVQQNLPVLFVFHGDNSSGPAIRDATGFNSIADAGNFLVVYPSADTEGWNRAIDQTKDSQFVSDLIDHFCSSYHINAQRVYATGFSAGGYMTYNLAVNLPDRVAAFVPVSANMYANSNQFTYFGTSRFVKVPICHIHGDLDNVVSYIDGDHKPGAWDEWPLSHFAYYSCNTATYTSVTPIVSGVSKLHFCTTASGGKEISLIRVEGKGHEWLAVTGFDPAQAAWDFVKNYSLPSAKLCDPEPDAPVVSGVIYTSGRNLMSACGKVFAPRGVNYSLADDWEFPANMNGDPTHVNDELSAEIIKAKPNAVRIQWYVNRQAGWKAYTISDLDMVITRFRNAGIVSVIDLHDLTCSSDYATFNTLILPWWKQQAVLNLLNKHRGYVIANLANEFGNVRWTSNQAVAYTTWFNHYKNAITELRNAGIEVPLMIDAPDCGQSLDVALEAGEAFKQHDPLHNIVMSAHAYWYQSTSADMTAKVQQIASVNFPVILGEIANKQDETSTPCAYSISQYTSLLQSCQTYDVGWLAWTWTDDWCAERRMSTNGSFSALTDYGNVIINHADFGLATHAQKMDAACLATPLPVKLIDFSGFPSDDHTIRLTWSTSVQEHFKEFIVERSAGGKRFTEIGMVKPEDAGIYVFEDRKPESGVGYYRLRMLDEDGSYALSRVISVAAAGVKAVKLFPSPAKDYMVIGTGDQILPGKVVILNAMGRQVLSAVIASSEARLNISGLTTGVYTVMFNGTFLGKIVIE